MSVFFLILAFGICIYAVFLYNRLVGDRQLVRAAWSDIDVQLQLRHDLIPKLLNTTSGYAAHERRTLERVTALRRQAQQTTEVAPRAKEESALNSGLKSLLLLVEDYPELKADDSFLELQSELSRIEERIQKARRFYNGAVRRLNTRLETFPDLVLARLFGYRKAAYFELDSLLGDKATEGTL